MNTLKSWVPYLLAAAFTSIFACVSLVTIIFSFHSPTRACGGDTIGGGADRCFGTIALRQDWDTEYYEIFDSTNGYLIAGIDEPDQYIATDNKIYVIDRHSLPGAVTNSNGEKDYFLKLFQNGQMEQVYYGPDIFLVPRYFVINYITNEVDAYTGIDAVPDGERGYFRDLEMR